MTRPRFLSHEDRIADERDPDVLRGWLDRIEKGLPVGRDLIPGELEKLVNRINTLEGSQ